jgi:hypothetical protein
MLVVRQAAALGALLLSMISSIGWMVILVFILNEFLEGHLLTVLWIGVGGSIVTGTLIGGWPMEWIK